MNAIATVVGGEDRRDPGNYSAWMVADTTGRVWRAIPDGSLTGSVNAEIVSPILTHADLERLQEVVRAVKRAVAKNRGKPPRTIIEGWKTKLGIERRVRFHDLRHTCASHLVMGAWGTQWTLQEVAAFLGHADTTVTEIYAYLSPDHLHRRADATFQPPQSVVVESPLVPPGTSQTPGILLARPRGLEPLTSRSVVQGQSQRSPEVAPQNPRPTPSNPARAFLEAVARREPELDQAFVELCEYALLVGFADEVVLVMSVEPQFRVRRALDLVRVVLAAGQGKKAEGA
ncbi:MAG: tyrosine-type recombinase/integrase [Polyangiales bacterium]